LFSAEAAIRLASSFGSNFAVILTGGFSPTYASAPVDGSCIVAHAVDVRKAQLMKTARSESHHEAIKALALAVVGVMAIMLIWNLVMRLFY
jgi:hypothetical protein